jgi:hypothetical protein
MTFVIEFCYVVVVYLPHTCYLFTFMHNKVETKITYLEKIESVENNNGNQFHWW